MSWINTERRKGFAGGLLRWDGLCRIHFRGWDNNRYLKYHPKCETQPRQKLTHARARAHTHVQVHTHARREDPSSSNACACARFHHLNPTQSPNSPTHPPTHRPHHERNPHHRMVPRRKNTRRSHNIPNTQPVLSCSGDAGKQIVRSVCGRHMVNWLCYS